MTYIADGNWSEPATEPRHRTRRPYRNVLRPGRGAKHQDSFPDRTCNCGTKLNRYNTGDLCYRCDTEQARSA